MCQKLLEALAIEEYQNSSFTATLDSCKYQIYLIRTLPVEP